MQFKSKLKIMMNFQEVVVAQRSNLRVPMDYLKLMISLSAMVASLKKIVKMTSMMK